MKIQEINNLYKSELGDKLAVEELLPIIKRYINKKNPKILEIGCGYGRNLYALAQIEGSEVLGCDIAEEELQKAKEKMDSYKIKNVHIVSQKKPDVIPFADNEFDFVVVWQVFEHVLDDEGKQKLMNEATRVVKSGGHVLIETPNFLFPFDYHDNGLPLVHWIFSNKLRRNITKKIRKEDYPPSQYTTLFGIKRLLKQSPHTKTFKQKTKIYFEEKYFDIFRNLGGTRKKSKIIFFVLYAPIYFIMRLLFLPGDIFTPSLRIVFHIKK
jgi:ubiquinone/menaquinone biosynthesis C-methylase UbiE